MAVLPFELSLSLSIYWWDSRFFKNIHLQISYVCSSIVFSFYFPFKFFFLNFVPISNSFKRSKERSDDIHRYFNSTIFNFIEEREFSEISKEFVIHWIQPSGNMLTIISRTVFLSYLVYVTLGVTLWGNPILGHLLKPAFWG